MHEHLDIFASDVSEYNWELKVDMWYLSSFLLGGKSIFFYFEIIKKKDIYETYYVVFIDLSDDNSISWPNSLKVTSHDIKTKTEVLINNRWVFKWWNNVRVAAKLKNHDFINACIPYMRSKRGSWILSAKLWNLGLVFNYSLVYIPYSSTFMVHIPSYKLNIFIAK